MRVDRPLLKAAPALRYVLRPGSGLDDVDLDACREQGVQVLASPEGNRDAVGEYCVGVLLDLIRNLSRAQHEVRRGAWVRAPNRGPEVRMLTIGIIGYGHTGPAFASRLAGWGARILVYDPYRGAEGPLVPNGRYVSLTELQAQSDVVSFHVPLTGETHHYLDDYFVARMAKPFWLINSSRGAVVDGEAVLRGLEQQRIRGAALDVLPQEPPQTSFLKQWAPWQDEGRLILTPHIAGWSHYSRDALYQILLDKLQNHLEASANQSFDLST